MFHLLSVYSFLFTSFFAYVCCSSVGNLASHTANTLTIVGVHRPDLRLFNMENGWVLFDDVLPGSERAASWKRTFSTMGKNLYDVTRQPKVRQVQGGYTKPTAESCFVISHFLFNIYI